MGNGMLLFCIMALLSQQGLCAINFLHFLTPDPNFRTGRYCGNGVGHQDMLSNTANIEEIRNELLDITSQRFDQSEMSEAVASLITKAVDAVSELMADGNSSKLLSVTSKTGRMFSAATASFARLLDTIDDLLIPADRFDDELMVAKLKLVETTKDTLGEFLQQLGKIAGLPLMENEFESEEFLHAEEILIDRTKEAYQIVYESTENTVRDILHSDAVSRPVKKLIAAKVITSAANNLNSFASLRRKIYDALTNVADKKAAGNWPADLDSFQDELKNELLTLTWSEDSLQNEEADEESHNSPLTPDEQKELLDILKEQDKEFL